MEVSSVDGLNPALPVGIGIGPAEINMRTIFGSANAGVNTLRNEDFYRLMYGDTSVPGASKRRDIAGVTGLEPCLPRGGLQRYSIRLHVKRRDDVGAGTRVRIHQVCVHRFCFGGRHPDLHDQG